MNLQKMFESQFLETVPMKAVEQKKRPKENGKRKFYQRQLQRKRKTSEKVQQVHSVSNDCSNKSIGRTVRYYGAKRTCKGRAGNRNGIEEKCRTMTRKLIFQMYIASKITLYTALTVNATCAISRDIFRLANVVTLINTKETRS